MRFIFSLGIFFGATLILLFSINISTPRFMRKMINTPDFTKNVYEYVETKEEFPDYKIDNIGGELCLDCNETGISEGNTYRKAIHNILKEKNSSKRIDLTVVFLEDYDPFKDDEGNFHLQNSAFKDVFDLDGYLRQDKEENMEYILDKLSKYKIKYEMVNNQCLRVYGNFDGYSVIRVPENTVEIDGCLNDYDDFENWLVEIKK